MNRADSSLRRLTRLLVFELVTSFAAVVVLGSFLAHHVRELRFAAPAVALALFALYLVVASIRQLAALALRAELFGRPRRAEPAPRDRVPG